MDIKQRNRCICSSTEIKKLQIFKAKNQLNCLNQNNNRIKQESRYLQKINMIDSSSKRLSKIKKKLKKNQTSDYYFFINSHQRESNKQNYASNHQNHNKTSLKNSIQLKKFSLANSFDNYKHFTHEKHFDHSKILNNSKERTKINIKNSLSLNQNIPFFQNVKFLNNSRIIEDHKPESTQNKFIQPTKGYQKNIELSQNRPSKFFHEDKQPKSNKFTQDLGDSLDQKVEAYVEFVNEFLEEMIERFKTQKNSSIQRKKCLIQTLGKQLLRQSKKGPGIQTINNLSKSIEVSNFRSFPSKVMSRQLERSMNLKQKGEQNVLKRVIELQQQNTKLTQLISEHERKNIKMFVKMNENESKEIERCKKYLSSLYDKYKLLEKYLLKQNEKYKKVCQEKKELQTKFNELQAQNSSLSEQLQKIKEMFEEMNSQTLSKVSFEQDLHNKTIFNFNLVQNNPRQEKKLKSDQSLAHQQSQQISSKIDKSFITKREKAASCLSRHVNGQMVKNKDDQIMSCSTITKTKNMKKKKPQVAQKISGAVNLKDQFNQIAQDELISLKKEINNLKQKQINGLKQKEIFSLKQKEISSLKQKLNDETVTKMGLQKQVNSLESTVKKSKEKLQKREEIIKDQLVEIQKLMETNKRLQSQLRSQKMSNTNLVSIQGNKKRQSLKGVEQVTEKGVEYVLEQIKRLNEIKTGKNKNQGNCYLSGFNQSEYRIIAMQAGVIESLIHKSQ